MRGTRCEECTYLWRKYGQLTSAYLTLADQRDQIATDDPQRLGIVGSIAATAEALDEIRAAIVAHEAQVHGRKVPLVGEPANAGQHQPVRRILDLFWHGRPALSPKAS